MPMSGEGGRSRGTQKHNVFFLIQVTVNVVPVSDQESTKAANSRTRFHIELWDFPPATVKVCHFGCETDPTGALRKGGHSCIWIFHITGTVPGCIQSNLKAYKDSPPVHRRLCLKLQSQSIQSTSGLIIPPLLDGFLNSIFVNILSELPVIHTCI